MNHTERRTHDTHRRHRRQFIRCLGILAAAIDEARYPVQYLRATRQHPRADTERLHEHQPPERRLLIEKHEQRTQTRANTRSPILLCLKRRARERCQLLDAVVERREKTAFAILKQVIESL